jgi:hypothetical protein
LNQVIAIFEKYLILYVLLLKLPKYIRRKVNVSVSAEITGEYQRNLSQVKTMPAPVHAAQYDPGIHYKVIKRRNCQES